MQVKYDKPIELLDKKGFVNAKGYAFRQVINYQRKAIKSAWYTIKEWDFYQMSNEHYCLQMTIGHVSYCANLSCNLVNLDNGKKYSMSKFVPFIGNGLHMPSSAEKDYSLTAKGKDYCINFDVKGGKRHLTATGFDKGIGNVDIDINLSTWEDCDKMIIATPFEKPKRFYYNYKQNCFSTSGHATFGDVTVKFDNTDTYGLLDWGRGVWPFSHSWYWGNGSCKLKDGRMFGYNIGWGFGDTSNATENMIFVDGVASKLDKVEAKFNFDDYMSTIDFVSSDKRFEMKFTPKFDNLSVTKLLFVDNKCHQVFGYFTGNVVTDSGETIKIDKMWGFCEHAINHW